MSRHSGHSNQSSYENQTQDLTNTIVGGYYTGRYGPILQPYIAPVLLLSVLFNDGLYC
jgi:hypothetical protein